MKASTADPAIPSMNNDVRTEITLGINVNEARLSLLLNLLSDIIAPSRPKFAEQEMKWPFGSNGSVCSRSRVDFVPEN